MPSQSSSTSQNSNAPTLAIIGGSGAYQLLAEGVLGEEKDCRRIDTPFGESAPIHYFSQGEFDYLFLSRHGENDYSLTAPYVNYRANVYALKACGIKQIIAWSGPGIIDTRFKPGDFALPHDILDETQGRESTFFKNCGWGFIRQSNPFCSTLRESLHDTLHEKGLVHDNKSVYVCTQGPRLETPAEIRKYRLLGADLVGMTLAPETFLARELEICYSAICYLTNYAEGVEPRDFQEGALFEGMQNDEEKNRVEQAIRHFPELMKGAFLRLKQIESTCHCQNSMQRYKDKGMIGEDWREWMGKV